MVIALLFSLQSIPRYVAVIVLFTGVPSLNEIVACSVSGLFIVTKMVLSRLSCIPKICECVSILCSIVFMSFVDLPNMRVSSAYSRSIKGSLTVCVWGIDPNSFQHLCVHHA